MKLWIISQSVNTGYDTYDSAVAIAANRTIIVLVGSSSFKKESINRTAKSRNGLMVFFIISPKDACSS